MTFDFTISKLKYTKKIELIETTTKFDQERFSYYLLCTI